MGGMVCGYATGCYVVWQQRFIVRSLIIKKLGHLEADYKMLHTSAIRVCRGFKADRLPAGKFIFVGGKLLRHQMEARIIHEMPFNAVHEQCVQYITLQKI